MRWWLLLAGVNGFLAVAAGAFGAHALRQRLPPAGLELFDLAARYQMVHALALLGIAWLAAEQPAGVVRAAGIAFVAGIVLFCGALYLIALTGLRQAAMAAPLGGLALMAGWLLLAAAALRR